MSRSRRFRVAIFVLALCWAVTPRVVDAQPDDAASNVDLTGDRVQETITGLEQLQESGQLSDEDKTRLQFYRSALEALKAAAESVRLSAEFDEKEAQAPVELEAVRAELAQPPAHLEPQVPPDATLDDLAAGLADAESDLATARTRLLEVEVERERHEARRPEITEQTAAAQLDIEGVTAQLGALPLPDESPALTEARRTSLLARRLALSRRIEVLTEERQNYDVRRELMPLQRDRWVRRINQLEQLVADWSDLVNEARALDIRQKREQATRAATLAHPVIAPIARLNVDLADRRDELTPEIENAQFQLDNLKPDPKTLQRRLDRLQRKVEVVGMTSTVGLLLRKDRADLPDTRQLRSDIKARQNTMGDLEFERLDLEDRHDALVAKPEQIVQDLLAELDPAVPSGEREAIETEIREQLRTQRDYLVSLDIDLTTYFDQLDKLNEKERQVVELTEELIAFIDQRILWIQSTSPLRFSDLRDTATALAWIFNPAEWGRIGRDIGSAVKSRWPAAILTVLVLTTLVAVRRRLRRRIRSIGSALSSPTDGTLGQAMAVTVLTVLRAALWPAVLWSIGAWLRMAEPAQEIELAIAVGDALQNFTVTLFVMLLALEMCQSHGLGEAHFGWRPRNLRVARHQIRRLTTIVLVFGIPVGICNQQNSHVYESSLGRLAFIAAVLGMALFVYGLLSPSTGVFRDVLAKNRGGWADRLRYIWFPAAVLTPLTLAVASILGYHYTALKICGEVLDSAAALVVISILYFLALRWIYFGKKKLAVEQARKRQLAYEERAARGEVGKGEAPPPVAGAQFDITEVSGQALQLLRSAVLFSVLLGSFIIWSDTLPAVGFLEGVPLWQGAEVATTTLDPAGDGTGAITTVYDMVTLQDLLWAFALLVITMIVAKNIPGLLEIAVLQHLPLERGSQFAISTIVRYTITIVGVAMTFGVIGITWAKVQWLAAALTVGLGFGLNEIFGNFISGLIILFERPIRVGDTVTVGEITGTINRIQIRSTTLRDWDRKELVIPNKVFVTDTIVNWTLSDQILRLVFPVVIEHDSDTSLAEELLLKVAKSHTKVLNHPAPSVMFKKVGDQGLEFDLRLFIPHIDHFVSVKHEIHNAINAAFREAGVRFFTFSHRDIDVRSIAGEVPSGFPVQGIE